MRCMAGPVGLFLSGLSAFGARIDGRDMATRHAIDRAVFDLRREIMRRTGCRRMMTGEMTDAGVAESDRAR